jgi:hypothetical protein
MVELLPGVSEGCLHELKGVAAVACSDMQWHACSAGLQLCQLHVRAHSLSHSAPCPPVVQEFAAAWLHCASLYKHMLLCLQRQQSWLESDRMVLVDDT